MTSVPLPLGKLPPELLAKILAQLPSQGDGILLGPGIGLDCAVVEAGPSLLVFKSEPITFVTDEIGWYAVQVSVNDIATTGARPRWLLLTLLLPEKTTTAEMVEQIAGQVRRACLPLGIAVIGGHTEITVNLDRPILIATLVGEVERERLITPRGAAPGDRILLTKGVPVEGTAILAREFRSQLEPTLTPAELDEAAGYLFNPGISVWKDAQLALSAGGVSAMHDPTEGGLAAALWEMAEACGRRLRVDSHSIPVPELAGRICAVFGIDPLATIASGALLIAAHPDSADKIIQTLIANDIPCTEIGIVEDDCTPEVWDGAELLPRPERDEIGKVYEMTLPFMGNTK